MGTHGSGGFRVPNYELVPMGYMGYTRGSPSVVSFLSITCREQAIAT
jgi:hypothetical protein